MGIQHRNFVSGNFYKMGSHSERRTFSLKASRTKNIPLFLNFQICQLVLEFLCVFALLKGITKVLPHALIPFMVFVFFQLMGVVFIVLDLIIIVVLPLKEAQYIISVSPIPQRPYNVVGFGGHAGSDCDHP